MTEKNVVKKRKRATTVIDRIEGVLEQLPQFLATANSAAEAHTKALAKWEKQIFWPVHQILSDCFKRNKNTKIKCKSNSCLCHRYYKKIQGHERINKILSGCKNIVSVDSKSKCMLL